LLATAAIEADLPLRTRGVTGTTREMWGDRKDQTARRQTTAARRAHRRRQTSACLAQGAERRRQCLASRRAHGHHSTVLPADARAFGNMRAARSGCVARRLRRRSTNPPIPSIRRPRWWTRCRRCGGATGLSKRGSSIPSPILRVTQFTTQHHPQRDAHKLELAERV